MPDFADIADDVDDDLYIEQAEYIERDKFIRWSADHPNEDYIIGKLSRGGAKLIVGPRGCGKTTLMLKAYYRLLNAADLSTLPIYVNFKLSLQLEPLYVNTQSASFHFRRWLTLKTYSALWDAVDEMKISKDAVTLPSKAEIRRLLASIESGNLDDTTDGYLELDVTKLLNDINSVLLVADCTRCVLLFDDAAHAFSPKQQEDFFEFFRQVKSKEVSPKAAIYPGITTHSPTFHVGHDAEEINAWMRPDTEAYLSFAFDVVSRRLPEDLAKSIQSSPDVLNILTFASFGIPRSLLNMLRLLRYSSDGTVERRSVFDAIRIGRDSAHHIFDSLKSKVPIYKRFIQKGTTYTSAYWTR